MRADKGNRAGASRFLKTLAARNVKKSAKDYFIYFFTLTLSVCLFYSFNSVSTQFKSLGIEDPLNYLAFSSGVLNGFSILVCIIMGGLIVYANRFLLRRRKKEIGVYLTLGLERRELNRLLMKETLLIGIASLVFGVALGIFFAQLLSLATASLIGLSLSAYRFMFSIKAMILSVVFFGVLFFFVHRFNVRELKKMSLLDLLYADRKNESVPGNKGFFTTLPALLSILLLLGGYGLTVFLAGRDAFRALAAGGALLIVGTVFFFTALLQIAARLMEKNKRFYFRGLNMFTTGQFSSRLKTEGRIIAVTSILLFLSLSLMMLGPGVGKYVINGIENATPYDATIYYAIRAGSPEASADPMAYLEDSGFQLAPFSDRSAAFWTYAEADLSDGFRAIEGPDGDPLTVIGVEDYNRLLALQGIAPVRLGVREFALSYAFAQARDTLTAFQQAPKPLQIGNTVLTMAADGLYDHAWRNTNVMADGGTIIVPQDLTEKLTPVVWYLNFDLTERGPTVNSALRESWLMHAPRAYTLLTGEEALVSVAADNLLMTYLGLYLGVTFLIASGAVLALQQLSQSADNTKRFNLLKKLGASKKALDRTLRQQLMLYFGLPLFMALLNTAVVVTAVFRCFHGLPLTVIAAIAGFSLLLAFTVYAIYFLTTYFGSKRILKL